MNFLHENHKNISNLASKGELENTHLKKMFMVLDTETLGWKPERIDLNHKVFDLGYKIIDSEGKTYSQGSFIVSEFWFDIIRDYAFYKEKIHYYLDYVESGYTKVLEYNLIMEYLKHECEVYEVDYLVAYNLGFDDRVLKTTYSYFNQELPVIDCDIFSNLIKFDLYHVVCQTILATPKYIKWASKNYIHGHVKMETTNVSTGAESCYAYITNTPDFIEQHTALSDVEIECDILVEALKTSKDYDISINSQSWRLVNNRKDKDFLVERANPMVFTSVMKEKRRKKKEKEKLARKKAKDKKKKK